MNVYEQEVLNAVNNTRTNNTNKVPALSEECAAVSAARIHNHDVLLKGKSAHSDICGRANIVNAELNQDVATVAEVAVALPLHFETSPAEVATRAVDAWMNSTKGHHDIILSSKYTSAGVGVVKDKADVFWITMILVQKK